MNELGGNQGSSPLMLLVCIAKTSRPSGTHEPCPSMWPTVEVMDVTFHRPDNGQVVLKQWLFERLACDKFLEQPRLSEVVDLTNSAFVNSWKTIPGLIEED